jgi:hypothetical protein
MEIVDATLWAFRRREHRVSADILRLLAAFSVEQVKTERTASPCAAGGWGMTSMPRVR